MGLPDKLPRNALVWLFACASLVSAQEGGQLRPILERLDALEKENQRLTEEIRALRRELAETRTPAPEATQEQLAIQERRTEELAQTKVEASQKFPLRVTGMALFNAFLNGRSSGTADYPTTATATPGLRSGGATLRQTTVGLLFDGPRSVLGAQVHGSVYADFYGGSNTPLSSLFRLRTGSLSLDWNSRSLMVGLEKPIFSPREPNSLAQVGVSPLTNSGNLWLWQPQVMFEQRFTPGGENLRAQIGIFQSNEASAIVPAGFASTVARARPMYQGRFEWRHELTEKARFELAPGFQAGTSHIAGTSVPSRLFTLDWFVNPVPKLEFTGAFFNGSNISGLGALRQSFLVLGTGNVLPVHSRGGWAQFSILATDRLTFNLYGGQHDDRNADLRAGGIGKNQTYVANLMYRLAPNVVLSFERSQVRTAFLGQGTRLNNHYDLALAYLF